MLIRIPNMMLKVIHKEYSVFNHMSIESDTISSYIYKFESHLHGSSYNVHLFVDAGLADIRFRNQNMSGWKTIGRIKLGEENP